MRSLIPFVSGHPLIALSDGEKKSEERKEEKSAEKKDENKNGSGSACAGHVLLASPQCMALHK
ncbi:TPA: hypothetical protein HA361_00390 [Candidatus Woesearchaeota archaeon]|nr:hypothetical protein [Candidatus Woesearchaeota archaeon]